MLIALALAIGLLAAAPPDAWADDETAKKPEPEARSEHPKPAAKSERPVPVFVWKQHPSLRYKNFLRVDFHVKLEEDGRASYPGSATTAGLTPYELHRSRLGVQGTLFKHIDFEIERELSEKQLSEQEAAAGLLAATPWKDVNVNLDFTKRAQVQIGRFKIPFGLDELTGDTQNDYAYRSLGASYLAPSRDVGAMVHGRFFKRGLNYWAGAFTHDGDNARSKKIQGGDATLALRVAGTPLRLLAWRGLDGLELGGAYAVSTLSDRWMLPNGLRARTVLTQDAFFSPVYVKGERRRFEADLDWAGGPASLRAEYTHVSDDRQGQGFGDQDLPPARYRAWYISGSWLLTGERKQRPVEPTHAFLAGGIGAVELAVRVERLWCDSVRGADTAFANPRAETILPSGDRALTLGVNWTLNRFIKLQVNAVRERVEDPARSPVANGMGFWSRVARLQFAL